VGSGSVQQMSAPAVTTDARAQCDPFAKYIWRLDNKKLIAVAEIFMN